MSGFYNPNQNQHSNSSGGLPTSNPGGAPPPPPPAASGPYGGGGGGGLYGQPQQSQGMQWHQQPTQPSAPMQQQHQQQHQHQQAQTSTSTATTATTAAAAPPVPSFWDAATAATAAKAVTGSMSNDDMFNVASTISKNMFEQSSARFFPGLARTMGLLKGYFAVDNRYVQRKMRRVLFPYFSKNWKRTELEVTPNPTPGLPPIVLTYALPTADENAPDLYLPSMSITTYVLLCALLYGTSGKFNPEVLPDRMTKCFLTQTLEVLAMRVGFYLMKAPISFLDLFAYTGYKYLGLCLSMLVGLVSGSSHGYYVALLWTASSVSWFVLKVMANGIPKHTCATGPKREFMVLGFAASQLGSMWFLSETEFLG